MGSNVASARKLSQAPADCVPMSLDPDLGYLGYFGPDVLTLQSQVAVWQGHPRCVPADQRPGAAQPRGGGDRARAACQAWLRRPVWPRHRVTEPSYGAASCRCGPCRETEGCRVQLHAFSTGSMTVPIPTTPIDATQPRRLHEPGAMRRLQSQANLCTERRGYPATSC